MKGVIGLREQRLRQTVYVFLTGIIHDDRRLVCLSSDSLVAGLVLQICQFHVVGDSTKSHTGNNTPMKQAFSMSTPTHRE
jgi:hypothetical protein